MKHFGVHVPAEQTCPALHDVPSARGVHAVADVSGEHCSHGFVSFTAPAGTCLPSI
ncbi:hypothetical protein D187_007862 [Cystobacter fuscus DSM 2262]|uniref:Uncharacterized protein n=1 Tax=Cystobacter fuscus (strain ATCC 25194 / DSM 2262 / NBRC 100088 / M29) TaxID=1242864 RepID=S9NWD3_CYSF2|nr:hypothetical protein D187_007862 [Cystobacter fuscus DSM 2262]